MIDEFKENGFIICRNLIDKNNINNILERIKIYENKIISSNKLDSYYVLENTDSCKYIKYMSKPIENIGNINQIVNGKVFKIASELLGEDVFLLGNDLHQKYPNSNSITPVHQDSFLAGSVPPHNFLTIWIALDYCDEENGCLQVVKGSHKLDVLKHYKSKYTAFSSTLQENGKIPNEFNSSIVKSQLNIGDAIVFHGNTIHYAGGNKSNNRMRRGISLRFANNSYKNHNMYKDSYKEYLNYNRDITFNKGLSTKSTFVAQLGENL
jgi:phytanoyl-CoA hydroxylase